jgi:hypothetical protein
MATLSGGNLFGNNPAGTQIINGQQYRQYSPEWYNAMRQDEIRKAQTAGTAVGSGANAALTALGNVTGMSSSFPSSGIGAPGTGGLPPRIGSSAAGGGLPSYSSFDSGGGGGFGGAGGGGGMSGNPAVPQISMPDRSAAENAVFGAAKDQVGLETSGALSGLRSQLASRGLLGGQGEYVGTQGIFNQGQQQLGDVTRTQAETNLADQMDINKANLAAQSQARGEDISAATARRGQNMDYTLGGQAQQVTQRGQDIQYAESQAQLALTQSLQQAALRQSILSGIAGAIGQGLY